MLASIFHPASYQFNPYAIPTFGTAAAIFLLGLLVLFRERGSRVSLLFSLVNLAVGLWLFGFSWMYCAVDPKVALWWTRAAHLGIVLIPSAIYHFTVCTVNIYQKNKRTVWLSWALSLLFFTAILTSRTLISGLYQHWWGYYPRYDWLSIPFLVCFFGVLFRSLHHYRADYEGARSGTRQRRSKALMIAFGIGYLAAFDYLPAFGLALYPFGYIPVLVFIGLMAHAIWRYRLVDITPALAATQIIDTMADALLVLDQEGIVRIVNQATCRLCEKSEDELVGMPVTAIKRIFFTSDELTRLLRSGSHRDYEVTLRAEQDEAVTLSVSASLMHDHDQQPVAIVCVARDITKRKHAEDQVQRHRERDAALYDINLATTSTLELYTLLDALLQKIDRLLPPSVSTTVRLLNGANKQLEPVAGRNLEGEEWQSEEWEAGRALITQVFHSRTRMLAPDIQTDPRTLNARFFRKHDLASYLGVPLIAKGETLGVLSFYTKAGKEFSDEEIEFLSTLAGQAAIAIHNSQLYEQMKKQAVELEKANKVKDEFLGVMSHELRTPLNLVMGYTEMIKERMLGEITPEQDRILGKLLGRAKELLTMISGILEATNIGSQTVTVKSSEVNLAAFLDDLRSAYDVPLGSDFVLHWDYPPNLPVMKTDREKLRHIVQNLINNALKFTDKGEIAIAARHLPATRMMEFKVTDTGIGISHEALPSIFEMFHQVDSSETRAYGGVGLGLYIVKKFTELLGGTVKAESEPHRGSTFTVTLPVIYIGNKS
jgi:PAS domain S-box-containing protein